jgi:hypothetical protein
MTREQFHELLHTPATIRLNLIRDLEEITGQYPYFHNAHLLLAKQYKGHENIRFEGYLRKASAYAPDRTVLFDIIHQEPETVIHIGEEVNQIRPDAGAGVEKAGVEKAGEGAGAIPQDTEQTVPVIPELKSQETGLPEEPPSTEDPKEKQKELTPREILESRLREIERGPNMIPEDTPSGAPRDLAAHESTVLPEEKTPVVTPGKPVTGKQPPTDSSPATPASGGATGPIKPNEPAARLETHSFIEWLRLKQIPIEHSSAYKIEGSLAGEPEKAIPVPGDPSEDLIDRFIRNEPRIVPARSEFYSPGNMARQSAVVHEELISETLARIYANQGNLSKAIETLEKLALKNPGKSRYFAALIEELTGHKPD